MRDINENLHSQNSRAKFKQRIAGGAVLVIVLAIFLPFIFSHSHVTPPAEPAQQAPATNAQPAAAAAPANANADINANNVAAPTSSDATVATAPEPTATAATIQPVQPVEPAQPNQNPVQTAPAPSAAPPADSTQSMSSDQPGLTPPQSESAAPTATTPAPAPQQPLNNQPAKPSAAPAPLQKPSAAVSFKQKPVKPSGHWVVQVGSFTQPAYAQQLALKLRERGFQAYTRREPNHRVHVYVGPVVSAEQAQKVQQKVQTEFHLSSLVKEKRA